jgi:iron complex outermembrane receptor protein
MLHTRKTVLALGTAVVALTGAGDALAQQAIDEIVVTARRVEESLQDVPVSVTALTDEQLDVQQIETIADLAATVPNLTATGGPQGATDANFFIRGVGQFDFIVTNDPGVGVYVDGVYLGRTVGALVDTGAVQRIEVLKGPQGTLFGRNTIGGAINVTTKAPDPTAFSGEAELTVGARDRVDIEAGFNVPLGDDAAFLIYGQARKQDGWRERVDAFGVEGDGATFGDIERESLNASFLYEPTDALTVTLRADWTEDSGSPRPVLLAGAVEGFGADPETMTPPTVPPGINAPFADLDDDETIQGGRPVSEAEVWGTSATVEYDFGGATLKSITAYRELNAFSEQDNDGTPFQTYNQVSDAEQSQFSQEVQLYGSSMDDRLSYLVGLYYFEESAQQVQRLCLGGLNIPGDTRCGFSLQDNDQDVESFAIFGEVDVALTDALTLTLGGRYTDESKDILANQGLDFSFLQTIGAPPPFAPPGTPPSPPSAGPAGYFLPTLAGVEQGLDFEEFNPRIGLSYQASDDLLLYANYAEGFRSGGFNGRVFVPTQEIPTFDADTNVSYEAGFKSDLLESRLRLNAAAFFQEYQDIQQTVTDPVLQFFVANAAEAELYGFEIEATAVPVERALISVGIGYTHSEFTEVDPALAIARVEVGNELAFTPEFSAAIGASYEFDLGAAGGLLARADYNWLGDHYFSPANQELEFQEGYGLLNLTLVYRPVGERYAFSVFGTNVTDESYNTFGQDARFNQGVAFVFPARPAEWGASLSVDF